MKANLLYFLDKYKLKHLPNLTETSIIVQKDVEAIRNGKRYPPRGYTEKFRIPEDISTGIALRDYGIDAYEGRKY